MKSQHPNYPRFCSSGACPPLTCRVAGLTTEELFFEFQEIHSFFRYGSYGMSEISLRNQMYVMLEGREVPEEVLNAAAITGTWLGDRTRDRIYPPDRV